MKNKKFSPVFLWRVMLGRILIGASLLGFVVSAFALSFPLPKKGEDIVGTPQTAVVQSGDDFSDVAIRFDVGYYEMFEANPGVDPDDPPVGAELVVPTQYIIPPELKPDEILVDLAEMRLYFWDQDEKKIYIFPVGIGKADWNTPTGIMSIVKKDPSPSWTVPESIRKFRAAQGDILPKVVPPGPENPLGDYALRLSRAGYLIHGTNLPAGVGRRSSAGCIRLYPDDIEQLFKLVKIGTKVLVINNPYKAGWLNGKLYLEAHMPLLEQRLAKVAGDMTPVVDILEFANKGHNANIDWQKAFRIAREHLCVPRPVEH